MRDCGVQSVNSATSDCIVLLGLADVEPGQCLEPLSMWSVDLSVHVALIWAGLTQCFCFPHFEHAVACASQEHQLFESTCQCMLPSACLGDEATLLWTFFDYPKDLATCCVRQVWKATTKTPVHSRYRAENAKRPGLHE
eukprot:813051-Amphidinium_carterae.1